MALARRVQGVVVGFVSNAYTRSVDYRYTRHALDRIAERRIPLEWIKTVLASGGEPVLGHTGREVRQGRFERDGRRVLLRVIVEGDLVITALVTSKIEKYGG